jgi:hypothetical protein
MSSEKIKVYIPCGGGLGDTIQAYLADPPNHWMSSNYYPNDFPSSDNYISLWLRRLENFKDKHPDSSIKIITRCHNPAGAEFLLEHPSIDGVELNRYLPPNEEVERWWEHTIDGYTYVAYLFDYNNYESSKPTIYTTKDELNYFNSIISDRNVVIHPFAGCKERTMLDINNYKIIIDRLIDNGYTPIVVGGSYKLNTARGEQHDESFDYNRDGLINLVNIASSRLSVLLVMNSCGFIGAHSAMILPAWYRKIRSICILPPLHDGGQPIEDFIKSNNPTAWGFGKYFNKNIIVRDINNIDYDCILSWVTGGV